MNHDIRRRYNIRGPDVTIAADILRRRYPTVGEQAMPGFDCLVVVLRSIYSNMMIGNGTPIDWSAAAEEKNPILGYAWSLFDSDEKEKEVSLKRRSAVLQAISGHGTSFGVLCTSALMNETFWSQDIFRLSRNLRCIGTGQIVERSADEIARASILEFDHAMNPNLTLGEVVNRSFGVISFNGQDVASIPNNPWIVRLLYKPALNASKRLDINGLKTLYLPVWEQVMSEADACYHEVRKEAYFLLAVVRMQGDDFQPEYVRTYNRYGANILAEYEQETFVDHK